MSSYAMAGSQRERRPTVMPTCTPGSQFATSPYDDAGVVVLAPARYPAVVVECEECDVLVAVGAAVLGNDRVAAVLGDDDLRVGRLVDRVDDHREAAERVAREALELSDRRLADVAPRHVSRSEGQLHDRVVGEQLDQLVDPHLVGESHDLAHAVDVRAHAGFWFPTTHIEKNCDPPPYAWPRARPVFNSTW